MLPGATQDRTREKGDVLRVCEFNNCKISNGYTLCDKIYQGNVRDDPIFFIDCFEFNIESNENETDSVPC